MTEEATGFAAAVEAEGKPVTMNGEEDERNSGSASSQVNSSESEEGTESSSRDVTNQREPPINPVISCLTYFLVVTSRGAVHR
jgi:hypothetical protein